jgi:outer membrane receptor for ferrienterochelin and colicin
MNLLHLRETQCCFESPGRQFLRAQPGNRSSLLKTKYFRIKSKLLLCGLLIIVFTHASAQQITLSGTVSDGKTGEPLIGANIYNPLTLAGTATNLYGFYSLKFPSGTIRLTASYTGYQTVNVEFVLSKDSVVNISLEPVIELSEVIVSGQSPIQNVQSSQMGTIQLSPAKTDVLPVLFGERDIIKTLQLMPGVQGGTEGASGFYVRGGGPDQNLILLDGVPVYNVSHLFGFLSVFNSDAIRNVTLIKGGFPARYGGRLSSVVDIRMKEGNNKEFKGDASIGLLSSNITLEGPIIKERTSFMVSGRRSYFDLISYPFQMMANKDLGDDEKTWAGYYLQDFNGKVNHILNERQRLYLSIYTGVDNFYMNARYKDTYTYDDGQQQVVSSYESKDKVGLKWGNTTGALRWNYIVNNELFANVTGTVSNYRFQIFSDYQYKRSSGSDIINEDYYFKYYSRITDYGVKADFDYIPNTSHYVRFGAQNTLHYFSPGVTVYREKYGELAAPIDTTFGNRNIVANELNVYLEDDFSVNSFLKVNGGLHFSFFNVQGASYLSLEPRFSSRFMLTPNLSLKASYASMQQYLHLLANSSMGLPTDLWVPATKKIKPQRSDQIALGLTYSLKNIYEFSLEGYYKKMHNLIDYSEGSSFFDLNQGNWEDLVTSGDGESYGAELLLQKNAGRFTGWIGYTLSWSYRQFEEISFGKKHPYKYDSRHDISIVGTYKLTKKTDIGAVWTYRTGYPFTLEDEKYNSPMSYFHESNPQSNRPLYPVEVNHYETRNNYRMPDYHRLDLAFNFHKQRKKSLRTWSIGVYNAYGRNNPFIVYSTREYDFQTNEDITRLKQLSLFSYIPYFRWSIKF